MGFTPIVGQFSTPIDILGHPPVHRVVLVSPQALVEAAGREQRASPVPALHRECEAEQDGDLTRNSVDMFVDVATKAIPVIDEIER